MNVSEIISSLPKLSPQERKQVLLAANILGGGDEAEVRPNGDALVFEALCAELRRIGVRYIVNYEQFSRMNIYKTWKTGSEQAVKFLKEHFPDIKKKIDKLGILRFLIDHLMQDMRSKQIPVTLGSVAGNIGRLPEIFDHSFPGYLESGLGAFVIRAMRQAHR